MEIREGGLDEPAVVALLAAHMEDVRSNPTPGGVHVRSRDQLRAGDITFWSAWRDDALLGCAALREIEPGHGEIKSMRTAPDQLRRGAGAGLMAHILGVARERGYRRISLETGTTEAFEAAQALYRQFGFTPGDAFGDYAPNPQSLFLTRVL
ncbi:MAG: GNAT family N-acetyltransferase [Sphingomonas sp.]|nr:GNAT family N-acetyltransferase [Sphingomonas sp.]